MGYFRRSPAEREAGKRLNRTPAMRQAARYLAAALFFALSPWVLSLAVFSPGFTGRIWQSAAGEVSPAHDLLTGYLRWYRIVLAVWGGATAGSVAMAVLLPIRAARNFRMARRTADGPESGPEDAAGYSLSAALLLAAVGLPVMAAVLGYTVLTGEGITALPSRAQNDLAQMEAGTLIRAEVWIYPNGRPARLPGPSADGQPKLTTCYGILGGDTGDRWLTVHVPNALDFSPDPDRPFDETQTAAWNREHARRYLVFYTSELHVVAEILPLPPIGGL